MGGSVCTVELDNLASAALKEWRVEDVKRELVSCRNDAIYQVSTPGQERYALRIHRLNNFTNKELLAQLQWRQALNKIDFPAPHVIPAANGDLFRVITSAEVPLGRQCELLTWVDGTPVSSLIGNSGTCKETLKTTYYMVGKLMARLHSDLPSWSPPNGCARIAWDSDSITGEDRAHGRFQELDVLTAGQSDLLLAAGEIVRHQLETFGRGPDRYGMIHANLFPDNILTTESGLQLIGFGKSGYGWYLFDLVTPAFSMIGNEIYDDILTSTIDGYRTARQLPDEHLAMLPTFLMARALTSLSSLSGVGRSRIAPESEPALVKTVCSLAEDFCS